MMSHPDLFGTNCIWPCPFVALRVGLYAILLAPRTSHRSCGVPLPSLTEEFNPAKFEWHRIFIPTKKHTMARNILLMFVFLFITSTAFSQQRVEKCSLPVVTKIKSNLKDPVAEDVRDFLMTFDQICLSDTEYTVNSNELLFMMLEQYPELLLKGMYDNRSQIDLKSIFYQFSHPANAKYNVEPMIERVHAATNYGSINGQVIAELKKIPK
jgi:hypothetical protein